MSKFRCLSCGATFSDTMPDGTAYFHACPDTVIDQHAECDPATGKVVKPATFKAVQNPRNENHKPHQDKPGEHVMVSEGLGVTEVE